VTFLEDYWQLNDILDMSEAELVQVRQAELMQISNTIISKMVRYSQSSIHDPDPLLFIQSCVNNTVIMNTCLETCAGQRGIHLTPLAISYIKLYIRRHVCLTSIGRLTIIQRQVAPRQVAVEQKKVLKTEVLCRPKEKKTKTEEPITCNVCFDELKPAQLVKTGCDHDFCADCIGSWAKQRGIKSFIQCPCCRTEIDTLTVPNKTVQKKVIKGLA
jgi:hypothetical protein